MAGVNAQACLVHIYWHAMICQVWEVKAAELSKSSTHKGAIDKTGRVECGRALNFKFSQYTCMRKVHVERTRMRNNQKAYCTLRTSNDDAMNTQYFKPQALHIVLCTLLPIYLHTFGKDTIKFNLIQFNT